MTDSADHLNQGNDPSEDCIFCDIVNGRVDRATLWEGDQMVAFHDAFPVAPIHVLVIPKLHIPNLTSMLCEDRIDPGGALTELVKCAEWLGLDQGFRMVNNQGKDGRQTVFHLHFHLLAGRSLSWPPG